MTHLKADKNDTILIEGYGFLTREQINDKIGEVIDRLQKNYQKGKLDALRSDVLLLKALTEHLK